MLDKIKEYLGISKQETPVVILPHPYQHALNMAVVLLKKCENEKIPVIVRNSSDIVKFHKDLKPLCRAYGLKIKNSKPGSFTLEFKGTENVLRFLTLDSLSKIHPTDVGIRNDIKVIIYLDTLPLDFYDEDVFVEDLSLALDQYKSQVGDFEKISIPTSAVEFNRPMFSSKHVKASSEKPEYIGTLTL